MQAFNVFFGQFFVLWRSVIYYVRTSTDIMFFYKLLLGKLVIYL